MVIRAIVSNENPLTWTALIEATGLEQKQLNKALFDLRESEEVCRIKYKNQLRGRYIISDKFRQTYSTLYNPKTTLPKWIDQWKESRELTFFVEHNHFFLEGRHLDDFSKELISHARIEVLIVNPFIQDCDLSNTLIEARRRRINVRVVTRSPRDKHPEYLKNKQDYFSKLEKEGILVQCNEKIHAKLIIVDHSVAIVSSMNFYPDSSAGVSWEAGIVSIDPQVVNSAIQAIEKMKT